MTGGPAAVVTGVSTGIGRAAAIALAAAGWRVFGTVRRAGDAAAFEAALGGRGTALILDVTDEAAVRAAATRVAEVLGGAGLGGLVNNAGIAAAGPLQHIPLAEFRRQLDVNVTGVLAVTQAFLPLLGATDPPRPQPGRIVNVSSVSGTSAMPFLGPYAASKYALEGLSDSLRRELMIYGIDVVVIQPGSIRTPIWDKADRAGLAGYERSAYAPALAEALKMAVAIGAAGLPADEIGALVVKALTAPRPRARYARIPGGQTYRRMMGLIPARLLDRLIARRLGLTRRR